MSICYLLPCSCGNSVPVESHQAGGSVNCTCGQSLNVPSLRDLRELPTKASGKIVRSKSQWGARQGTMTFCLVMAVFSGGVGGGLWHYASLHGPPDMEGQLQGLHDKIESFTPAESYYDWVRSVRDVGLIRHEDSAFAKVRSTYFMRRRIAITFLVISAAMLLGVVVAVAWPKQSVG